MTKKSNQMFDVREWDTIDDVEKDNDWDPNQNGMFKYDRSRLRERKSTGNNLVENDFDSLIPYPNKVKTNKTENERCLYSNPMKLYDYQERCVRHMFEHRALAAFHGTGRGKSIIAAVVGHCAGKKNKPVLIVAPKSVLPHLINEYVKIGGDPDDECLQWLTHDGFHRIYKDESARNTLKGAMLIVDEVHNFRNSDGLRSETLMESAFMCDKVLLLTATPSPNSVTDLAVLMAILNKSISPKPGLFRLAFGPHGTDEQRQKLMEMFRDKISMLDDTIPDSFPAFERHIQRFEMTPVYLNQYLKLERLAIYGELPTQDGDDDLEVRKEQVDLVQTHGDAKLASFYTGLRQATNHLDEDGVAGSPKVAWVLDLIEKYKTQTVVYSSFKKSGIYQIANLLSKLPKRKRPLFGIIDGDTTVQQRIKLVQDYNQGIIRVLLLSKAGGEGLDLKNTKDLIVLEPPWNYAALMQIYGRVVRNHSHASLHPDERFVNIYTLVLSKPQWWYAEAENERRQLLKEIEQQRKLDVINGVDESMTIKRTKKRKRSSWSGSTKRSSSSKFVPTGLASTQRTTNVSTRDPRLIIRDSVDDYLLKLSSSKQMNLDECLTMLRDVSIEVSLSTT